MKIPDLELMLYSDGELDDERAQKVRVARLCRPEVTRRLENIDRVGDFVRVWASARGVDATEARRGALRAVRRRRTLGSLAVAFAALAAVAEPVAGERSLDKALSESPAVAIEAVDFGTHTGAVFVVEAGDAETPVIWLDDDAKADG